MGKLFVGLEAIDHQKNHPLVVELTEAMEQIHSSANPVRTLTDVNLGAIIRKHTGLNTRVRRDRDNDVNACVFIPEVDRNNPVINQWIKTWLSNKDGDRLLRRKDLVEGSVDLRNAKVSGDFSNIPVNIYLGREFLIGDSGKWTARETVAILMHEVGHAFTYFEFLGRQAVTNFILEDGARRLIDEPDEDRRIKMVKAIEKAGEFVVKDPEVLAQCKDAPSATVVLHNEYVKHTRNELGVDIYAERAFEKLADQFAARMGLAEDLATGLDTLFRAFDPEVYWSRRTRIIMNIVTVIGVSLFVIATAGWGIVVPIALLVATLINPNGIDDLYDKPARRIHAIRNELKKSLRADWMTDQERQETIRQLDVIEKIIEPMNEHEGLIGRLVISITPRYRKYKSAMQLQLDLEDLMASELYVAADRLKLAV